MNGPDIRPYSGHGGPVFSVVYAPDGATLAKRRECRTGAAQLRRLIQYGLVRQRSG